MALEMKDCTEVRPSPIGGLGLFATCRIPAGTVWWRATAGNVLCVSRPQYDELRASHFEDSPASHGLLEAIQIYGYINDDTDEVILALDNSRFVNHSDTPNSINDPADPNNGSMAARDIEPGEEITEDYRTYGMSSWDMPDEPYLR